QHGQIVTLHILKSTPDNGAARNQHDLDGNPQLVLVQAEGFAEQAPRTRAQMSFTQLSAGYNSHPRRGARWEDHPIGNQAAFADPLSLFAEVEKFGSMPQAQPASQAQANRRRIAHETRVGYTGVNRFRPTRRRFRRIARPLLVEFRLRKPCWRLRRILD